MLSNYYSPYSPLFSRYPLYSPCSAETIKAPPLHRRELCESFKQRIHLADDGEVFAVFSPKRIIVLRLNTMQGDDGLFEYHF